MEKEDEGVLTFLRTLFDRFFFHSGFYGNVARKAVRGSICAHGCWAATALCFLFFVCWIIISSISGLSYFLTLSA